MMDKRNNIFISGSMLKLIAVISMLLDHVAAYILSYYPECTDELFSLFGESVSVVSILRSVGRLAFPIFCFLLVEGFEHTRNRGKYALYLLLFAVISELPFDLAQSNGWNPHEQNVFFSLALGYLGMYIPSLWDKDIFNQGLCLLMISVMVICGQSDYGITGFLFIMCMYWFRKGLIGKMIAGVCLLPNPVAVSMATLPIGLYNGKRGFIQGNRWKFAFYSFYPVHLLIIYLFRLLLVG